MLQQTIRSWIDQLLVYIGISADSARGIDQWVILAIIVAIGVGLDFLIRLLLLQVVRRVVKQTKVTWDDITFTYGSASFLQRLSLKKTLMESVAVMLGSAWLLHERKRRKARHRR